MEAVRGVGVRAAVAVAGVLGLVAGLGAGCAKKMCGPGEIPYGDRCAVPCERLPGAICERDGAVLSTEGGVINSEAGAGEASVADEGGADASTAADARAEAAVADASDGGDASATDGAMDAGPIDSGADVAVTGDATGDDVAGSDGDGDGALVCPPGSTMDAGRCEVAVPRAIGPLSSSVVTTGRPRLRWELPAGVTSADVELCRSQRCAAGEVVWSETVTGTAVQPPMRLTRGWYYWRLRGRVGSLVSASASPSWGVFTQGRDTEVQGVVRAVFDPNQDGVGDLVIAGDINADHDGVLRAGEIFVVLGQRGGMPRVAQHIVGTVEDERLGIQVSPGGDIDGDGRSDLVTGHIYARYEGRVNAGMVRTFRGGDEGVLLGSVATIARMAPDTGTGFYVANAGDANGDGRGDIWVSYTSPSSVSRLLLGGTEWDSIVLPSGAQRALFDINGDSYCDMLVVDGAVVEATSFQVLFGGAPARRAGPTTSIPGRLVAAGDINGDGYADVIKVSNATSEPSVTISRGGISGLGGFVPPTVTMPERNYTYGSSIGDVNGDGIDDIVMVDRAARTDIFFGNTSDLPTYQFSLEEPINCGIDNTPTDINGDGLDDLYSIELGSPMRLRVCLAGPGGFSPSRVITIDLR